MHVMFDLETWGTTPGSALRSIGAVEFDPMGKDIGRTFYRNISKESCLDIGLTVDTKTEEWWAKQSKEASDALNINPLHMSDVALEFHNWFRSIGAEYIWCHGANFDEPLWNAVCRRLPTFIPWKFWNVRCTRTCYMLAQFDPKTFPRSGTHHNALDDATHQALCVQAAMRILYDFKPKNKQREYGEPS